MLTSPPPFRSGRGALRLPAAGLLSLYADVPSLSQYEHQVLKPASQNQPKDDVPAFYE